MRFLNATGDKERFLTMCLLRKPLRHLASVLPILVLFVRESASSITRWCQRVERRSRLLLERFPLPAIFTFLDRTKLCFELLPCQANNRKFVVIKADELVPSHLTVFMPRRVKDFPHTGRPITVLFKELRHRDGAGPFFPDICRVVQDSG